MDDPSTRTCESELIEYVEQTNCTFCCNTIAARRKSSAELQYQEIWNDLAAVGGRRRRPRSLPWSPSCLSRSRRRRCSRELVRERRAQQQQEWSKWTSAPVPEGYLSSGLLLACHGMAFACSLFCLFIYFYFWEMPFACSAAEYWYLVISSILRSVLAWLSKIVSSFPVNSS